MWLSSCHRSLVAMLWVYLVGVHSSIFVAAAKITPKGEVDLLFVRHGQSVDNLFPYQGPLGYLDPRLSPEGRRQAVDARKHLAGVSSPNLVFSSCMLRAQETALLLFENRTVHAAPGICEIGKSIGIARLPDWMERGNQFTEPRAEQQSALREDLGRSMAGRLSFDWAPSQSKCRPADWSKFQKWLWNISEVQDLIQSGERPTFAIVSHGNFITALLEQDTWDKGHVHNLEMITAAMPYDEKGFADLHIADIVFEGIPGQSVKTAWAVVFLAFLAVVYLVRRWVKQKKADGRSRFSQNAETDVYSVL